MKMTLLTDILVIRNRRKILLGFPIIVGSFTVWSPGLIKINKFQTKISIWIKISKFFERRVSIRL